MNNRISEYKKGRSTFAYGQNKNENINIKTINFNEDTNYAAYKDFFLSEDQYIILYGGAGSGKSYAVADKLVLEVLKQDLYNNTPLKILVIRKTLLSNKRTCLNILENRFKYFGLSFTYNTQTSSAIVANESKIIFAGVDDHTDIEKLKSLTDIDLIWIEEVNEITENAFEIIKTRLRGGQGKYNQLILTFNPVNKNNWLYPYFFTHHNDKTKIIKVNIDHNLVWKRKSPDKYNNYLSTLEDFKNKNLQLYNVYRLGEWGVLEDTIYTNYEIIKMDKSLMSNMDDYIIGVDFGFKNPSCAVLIGIKDKEYYILNEVYQSEILNIDFINLIKIMIYDKNYDIDESINIYADSAEQDRIEEFKRNGLNVYNANKDVKSGINYLQQQKLYINDKCVNVVKEIQSYCWEKDNQNNFIEKPVKFLDHTMDAIRYGILSHSKNKEYKDQLFI